MRRKNKKKSILLVLLMLIAGISMGYAILNTTLDINGTSKIKDAKWNVYWDNPQVTTGSVTTTAPIIDSLKTTATYDVTLNNPKDYYEFTIDVVNAGTIDAMIKVNGVSNKVYSDANRTTETTLPDAIKYTVTYEDGGTISDKHLLAKKSGNTPTRETYKVRIEYRNDEQTTAQDLEAITEETTYYMTFSVEYVQAENAIEAHPTAITYITRQNEGQITPGDVIGIGETEDFYVISSDAEKTVLLAKYNLLVGFKEYTLVGYDEDSNEIWNGFYYTNDDLGYGLQTVDVQEYIGGATQYTFALPFSSSSYWDDGYGTLLSPYNENGVSYDEEPYPYIYDSSVIMVPDFSNCEWDQCWEIPGYSIAYYVEQYKSKLIEMGAPSTITGRLLSYEEADALQSVNDINNESIIFHNQDYWIGSAYYSDVYGVNSYHKSIIAASYNAFYDNHLGVRPVIEIPTSELQ